MKDFYTVVISGDRFWYPYDLIERELLVLMNKHFKLLIVSGGAKGVDSACRDVCQENGILFAEVPAAWRYFGKRAGSVRNSWMLLFEPDLVLCFHQNIEKSKGTKHMKELAERNRVSVKVVKH